MCNYSFSFVLFVCFCNCSKIMSNTFCLLWMLFRLLLLFCALIFSFCNVASFESWLNNFFASTPHSFRGVLRRAGRGVNSEYKSWIVRRNLHSVYGGVMSPESGNSASRFWFDAFRSWLCNEKFWFCWCSLIILIFNFFAKILTKSGEVWGFQRIIIFILTQVKVNGKKQDKWSRKLICCYRICRRDFSV